MNIISPKEYKFLNINRFIVVYRMGKPIYKNKLVEGVDDDVWTKFTGYCKMNKIKVGQKLSEIIKQYLKQSNIN